MTAGKSGWKSTKSIIIIMFLMLLVLLASLLHNHGLNGAKSTASIVIPHHQHHQFVQKSIISWRKIMVNTGDSLAAIFRRLNIKPSDLVCISHQHPELAQLHPGQNLSVQVNSAHELLALRYPLSIDKDLIINRHGGDFIGKIYHKPMTVTLSYKAATVHRSLHQAAQQTGMTEKMLLELQKIFGGKVNFSREIHRNDRFAFLYQEYYIGGKKFRNGNIVAAEFNHGKKTYRAIRYTYPHNHTGYYTPDGHGVEPRFLKYPVHFKRVSSHFNRHRLDPVVHKVRPHLGVDFAAYRGTPIKSIGDGRVVFIGPDAGYGNAIKVRYGHHYLALYAHMWKFAKLKLHQYVHKGQVIGYVGQTGWATGPHLHFGFYVNGIAHDWLALKAKLPTKQPIPTSYKKLFSTKAKELLAELHLYQETQLATNNTKST